LRQLEKGKEWETWVDLGYRENEEETTEDNTRQGGGGTH